MLIYAILGMCFFAFGDVGSYKQVLAGTNLVKK